MTDPGICSPAAVKQKLKTLAKEQGVKVLPGAGTLTLATRKIPGGRDQVIQYVRIAAADGDPHAEVFLHVWDDLKTWEKKIATLDDVCAAAGIAPVKLVKALVGTAYESGCDIANLVAAHAHPDVVAFSTKMAKTVDGIEDRRLLMQHAGFLPQAKGQTINIGVSASASAQAAAVAGSDQSVPSFLDDVDALVEPVEMVQKQLIAASVPALPEPLPILDGVPVEGLKDAV